MAGGGAALGAGGGGGGGFNFTHPRALAESVAELCGPDFS